LLAVNVAGIAIVAISANADELGLTTSFAAALGMVNLVIVGLRQVLDPSTPTRPVKEGG
jgi:hypothetical protein